MKFIGVPLNADFSISLATIERHQPGLLFIAWLNNPTGRYYELTELAAIIETRPGLVIIDEAYHAFAGKTMLGQLQQFTNVLLPRTLSKLGFAGLRIGVLIGTPDWIQGIDKVRLPYNTGSFNQLGAQFSC